jgi:hypothetical protein
LAIQDCAYAVNGMQTKGVDPYCVILSSPENDRGLVDKVFGEGRVLVTSPKTLIHDFTQFYTTIAKH